MTNAVYSVSATAWGGREGRAASDDGRVDVQLSVPKALGGDDGPGTNPEQLFAAGYAACFHSALRLVARRMRLDVSESAVTASVSLVGDTSSGLDLAVRVEASLPGVPDPVAAELLQATARVCPYSRATRGNITAEYVQAPAD